ncbi:MAG: ABC-F family ATP-binding cassette domain-containing protein [Oscillospiraceae bacterium]|nr:ABC-F family ATP-binding cassette domain-containing protein [Oscillospiraceae bacterium]
MILSASSISKSFGDNLLFDDVTFKIEQNDIIGLVGANGCGKTTLFKILTGELSGDAGGLSKQSGLSVGYLQQHVCADSDRTALAETLTVFNNLIEMGNQLAEIHEKLSIQADDKLIEQQYTLTEKLSNMGGLTYLSRTRAALIGLGFAEHELELPVSALSGGQRSKIGLCKLLLSEPKLMLLDEPTNHLDIEATEWLEEYILSSKGAAVIISHDRYFLDRVTNKTWEIEHCRLCMSDGNYSRYLVLKKERELSEKRNYDNTMREVKRIEGIIEQQRQFNREKNIKTAESKQKQIDRMVKDLKEPEAELQEIKIGFKVNKRSGDDVLNVCGVSTVFDEDILYKNVEFELKRGDRVFIIGSNGCGKTTLLKSIIRQEKNIKFGVNVTVGYFDQHGENIDKEKTIFDELHDTYPTLSDTEVRNALAAFLFRGDEVFARIKTLSGGEIARVTLCKLMLLGSNLLILDEPTNHLDLQSREVLEEALANYDGTLLVVSHDRYFINRLSNRVLHLTKGGMESINGNYDTYCEQCLQAESSPATVKEESASKRQYKQKKERESSVRKLKSAQIRCETAIGQLESEIGEINESLSSPEISADYVKTIELSALIELKNTELEQKMLEWEEVLSSLSEFETESEL